MTFLANFQLAIHPVINIFFKCCIIEQAEKIRKKLFDRKRSLTLPVEDGKVLIADLHKQIADNKVQ